MFSDPEQNVLEFGFLPGSKVADLGSGAGHYSMALSKAVGPTGRVYAIDIQKDTLTRLKKEASHDGRDNVEVIWGDIEEDGGTKLREDLVDGAVFSNILFQLHDKKAALREALRVTKRGGKICIVEWSDLSFLAGVKSANGKSVVGEENVREMAKELGLSFERGFEAGEHHYGLIFKK